MRLHTVEIAVIGASLGGVMAAYQAARTGRRTLLSVHTPWLGGQMTAQGVPPDEHRLIESGGASASYLDFRRAMRKCYQDDPDFRDHTTLTEGLNPGDGWVSRLCFEPQHAARYFEDLLKPFIDAGTLLVLRDHTAIAAAREQRRVTAVTLANARGDECAVQAAFFLDATDTGEVIRLAQLGYRLGKEAQREFDEPDAPLEADPRDQQPVTLVMALARHRTAQPPMTAPREYAFWKNHVVPHFGYAQFSEHLPGARRGQIAHLPLFATGSTLDWWRYRRIVSSQSWVTPRTEISLVNWAQNDYALNPLLDGAIAEADVAEAAKALSLCFLYWLTTSAPRADGPGGYRELALAPQVLGTADGFAQQLYVRESRRIRALTCLTERDIHHDGRTPLTPVHVAKSVGIAWYNMDIHPTCVSGHGVNAKVRPFTLPLGAFIAADCDNLIPACKNLGVTHLVNAATRVHPVEWLVGEVAALLAHYAIASRAALADIHASAAHVQALQQQLVAAGIPLQWDDRLIEQMNPRIS
jgi:FAD dependent oxidoreductase